MKRRNFLGGLLGLALAAPAVAAPQTVSRIAFGSCAIQDEPQPLWDAIGQARPDLFAFLGDNIYADTEDMAVTAAKYARLGANPHFARFRERVPIIATWDDHDFGINDGGREYPQKRQSKRLMLEFFRELRASARWARDGVYTSYMYGVHPRRLQIILLDLRWFRSPLKIAANEHYVPNPDPQATLLGEAQWARLERQLAAPVVQPDRGEVK